ncbi:MAG: hypothetical protein ACR2FK_02750 [Sphingomicrobium sp.]
MKRLMSIVTVALLCTTACNVSEAPQTNEAANATAATGEGIEGTWKADLATVQIDEKPSVYLLKDGSYSCSTCVPPLTVAADGAFHPVADRPYYDSMSVKVVDDKTVTMVRKKGDRVSSEETMTLAADGNALTFDVNDMSTANAPPVKVKGTETRVAAAPAGAHGISGSWKTAKYDSVSDEGLTWSFDLEGDTLNMSSPAGTSYSAKIGGPAVPLKGDTGGTMVAVERLSANSIRETYQRDGKVTNVTTFTTGADGKLNAISENKQRESTMRYAADRL